MQGNIPFRDLLHYHRGQITPKMNYNFIFDIPLCLKLRVVCNCRRHKDLVIIIGLS